MKKIFLVFALMSLSTAYISAQTNVDSLPPKPLRKFNHVLKFGPFHMLAKRFNIGYEAFLANHKYSIYLSPTIYISDDNNVSNSSFSSNNKTTGYILDVQFRIYLGDTDLKNPRSKFNHLYLAPYGNYAYYKTSGTEIIYSNTSPFNGQGTSTPYDNSLTAYGGGVVFGYQLFLFRNKVSLDGYFGGGVRLSTKENNTGLNQSELFGGGVYSPYYNGIVPRIGFQIGYTL